MRRSPTLSYMKGDNGVGRRVTQENGHGAVAGRRKYLLMMANDDGRLNEEEECCRCAARDGPQGEVWCVREWVKEDSGPSSSVLPIASCQVTERDLRLSGPSLAYPDDAIVLCLPLRKKKKKNKKKKKSPGRIHFSPAISPLRQVMYPPLSPFCGPFSPRASYGSEQKDQIYSGRPFGIPRDFFFF